jgi:hypothetical protein
VLGAQTELSVEAHSRIIAEFRKTDADLLSSAATDFLFVVVRRSDRPHARSRQKQWQSCAAISAALWRCPARRLRRCPYYLERNGRSAACARGLGASDVINAVKLARDEGLRIAVRSGGQIAGNAVESQPALTSAKQSNSDYLP